MTLLGCAVYHHRATPMSKAQSGPEDGVRVTLSTASQQVALGDPMVVKVSLTNVGLREMALRRPFTASYGTVQFEVRESGSPTYVPARAINAGTKNGGLGNGGGSTTVLYRCVS
jgi:hypothetical protein